MTTVTISLPDSLREFDDSQVATKGHGNVSEYFRGLPREAQTKEHNVRLEALVLEGLASNSLSRDAAFRQTPRSKVERILEKHEDRAGS